MRSIDNMREYVLTAASVNATTRAVLAGYVDEIEREVEELVDERDLLKTQWEAGVDFDQRLEECADNREDVTIFGVDYTPLPVDADGVPIRIGDEVGSDHYEDGTVIGIQSFEVDNGSIRTLIAVRPDGWDVPTCHTPDEYRHHHAPTVEDVLREFGAGWYEQMSGPETFDIADYVERYAAKLRLAGEDE